MAGHSKFKNIQHRKGAQDAKRAKVFTKLVREIITATRVGNADIDFNPRLRLAISKAKILNLPRDRIENAIKKGSAPSIGENYEDMRYEGYMPGGVAVIVESLTDNRNRTASDVRSAFTKFGGNLGESNSVNFMFDRIGLIEYDKSVSSDEEIFEFALNVDAENCESDDESHRVITKPDDLSEIREQLIQKYGDPLNSKLSWCAQNFIEINDKDQAEKLAKFFDLLDDSDDVQEIYTNCIINI